MSLIVNIDGVDHEFKRMDYDDFPFPRLTIQLLGFPVLHLDNADADPTIFYLSAQELRDLIVANKNKT